MARTAIQFGAGNIGRGFLAQLFHESGLDIVFVDVVEPVIKAINERGAYTINIVGDGAQEVRIDRISGVNSRDVDRISAAIAAVDTEIVCTAVGAAALPLTAPYIACLLYTSPSPRDGLLSRMPSSA